jgi:hypothetical protein
LKMPKLFRICSNINVHREQMGDKAFYFGPDSVDELAGLMTSFLSGKAGLKPVFDNYDDRVKLFGTAFVNIFS